MPRSVTRPERPPCPLCGGELRFSHREYAGSGRSASVLRCRACGGVVRGEQRSDRDRPGQTTGRRRPMPEGGQPDNFVLDPGTADRLLRSLGGDEATPEE
ncbi:MAG: hypothetical protein WCB85_10035 [Candidatus Dormiibacterota bacterium]